MTGDFREGKKLFFLNDSIVDQNVLFGVLRVDNPCYLLLMPFLEKLSPVCFDFFSFVVQKRQVPLFL